MRSTQELPQRFLRMSRAYWVPKAPSKAGMHHRRTKYNRCFHLHAGPEHARHAPTVHEPNMIERMKGLSGSRLWHHPRPTVPFTASPRGGGHVRAAVSVTLPDALCRRRGLLFNGARDHRRSLNAERIDACPTPESSRARAAVKGAAMARAFDARLLYFSGIANVRPIVGTGGFHFK